MNYRLVSKVFGTLLFLLSGGMLVCAGYSWLEQSRGVENHALMALLWPAIITAGCGVSFYLVGFSDKGEILRKEAIAIVGGGWIVSAFFGMLPYLFSSPGLNGWQAFFESMSGFTTTGSTAIADLNDYPRAILLWRSVTQWMGGVGILVLFVALLTYQGVGSKALLRHESSLNASESTTTRIRNTALTLWSIYLGLTLCCFCGLLFLGMSFYDSLCHTLTTVSTGGFSPYNESIALYQDARIETFLALFMILSSINFLLYIALINRNWKRLLNEEEGRLYMTILLIAMLLIVTNLFFFDSEHHTFSAAVRESVFQIASIVTTTGFASANFDAWPDFSKAVLITLMFIGGCAGSTSGGIKVARILLFLKIMRQELVAVFRPKQVFALRINGLPTDPANKSRTTFFLSIMGVSVILGTLLLSFFEPDKDLITCFSATLTTLLNIGPGLGEVGPTETFTNFNPPSFLIMSLLMLLGRLELFVVLALFMPSLWKKY